MSLTSHFAMLGAPLRNQRWSWGGARQDGTLVLRVWQDQTRKTEAGRFVRLTHHDRFHDKPDDSGYQERLRHVEMIRQGSSFILLFCVAKDVSAVPRAVKEYDTDRLFEGGQLLEIDGDIWGEYLSPITVNLFLTANKPTDQ